MFKDAALTEDVKIYGKGLTAVNMDVKHQKFRIEMRDIIKN